MSEQEPTIALDELAALGVRLREAAPDEWPFRIGDIARLLDEQLQSSEVLRACARRIDAIATELGCDAIAGASSTGHQLAGAAVAASANGLRLFSRGAPSASVLVVDSLLASGVQLLRTARDLRAAGAGRVVGCVIAADRDGAAICRREFGGDVVALAEF
jgi:orotate phosphoribosyltransferase